jgi:hypothetical protein
MQLRRLILLILFVLPLAGCGGGETNQQVIDRYKPQFAQKRTQWQTIARKLPAPGTTLPTPTPLKLDPKPLYDHDGGPYNTEIVMVEQLVDPDAELLKDGKFDLLLSGQLLTSLRWTGPSNPMSPSVLSQRATKLCSPEAFETALNTRYLVVLRTLAMEKPVATSEKTYRGGKLELEGFLIDLASQELLAVFRVDARPARQGDYVWKEGEDLKTQMQEWVTSSMGTEARQKTRDELIRLTAGTFNFAPTR